MCDPGEAGWLHDQSSNRTVYVEKVVYKTRPRRTLRDVRLALRHWIAVRLRGFANGIDQKTYGKTWH